jgi:hypothetical protein
LGGGGGEICLLMVRTYGLQTGSEFRIQKPNLYSRHKSGPRVLFTENFKKQLNTTNSFFYQSFSSLADREMEECRFVFISELAKEHPLR